MKVVLLKNVKGTGQAGEIKEVSGGYVLNYLLPNKLARVAKNSDLRRKNNKSNVQQKLDKRDEKFKRIKKQIDGLSLTITAKADERGHLFGSVSTGMIMDKLKEKNIELDPKLLHLENIKETGKHEVEVDFGKVGIAKLTLNVKPE